MADAEPRPDRIENRVAAFLLALVPGGLVVYFSFNAGGFFPGTVGLACVIVIQLLIVRVLLADHPFEGFRSGVAVIGAPLAAFTAWILLSGLWSDSHDRVLIEFDRALLYLVLFLLFGVTVRTATRIPWMVRGLAAAIVLVSGVGLFSRLRPDVLETTSNLAINRLAYPVTYWNALGLLAAIGILLLLGLSASRTEHRITRAAAAAAVPILALTIYFTFSRGALLGLAIALPVFLFAGRSTGLLGTIAATVPTTLYAIVDAYRQDVLSSNTPKTAAAVAQGDHLLKVAIACVLMAFLIRIVTAYLVDPLLEGIELTAERRRRAWIATGTALGVALLVALAAGLPGRLSHQYDLFVHSAPKASGGDLRVRFTDPSNNGRLDHWRAAVDEFDAEPFHGGGAGTYEYAWNRHRDVDLRVVDAHNLYVEVLAEYGIVGLLLLLLTIAGIAVTLALRLSSRNRTLYAALLAAVVAWAAHAGFDWHWEMPAVTAWLFAVGGAVAAARAGARAPVGPTAQRSRVPVAAGLVVAAITPALLLFSQSDLNSAAADFDHGRGNCLAASRSAIDAIDDLSLRPQPYRMLGYCDIKRGHPAEAIAAMRRAVERGPEDWESHWGLALALASDGRKPIAEVRRALVLNPQEEVVKNAAASLSEAKGPKALRRTAEAQLDDALTSGALTFK
ncbi:MAG TPA: O-antigen ligase family protein [Thermoleophilaceae bacterium]|nr:O-antigen ligase family protein [Thermoleophilaceae bacterium]